MDPVSQIFLQARAPTGEGNTGYEAFAQGQQGARQNRQLDMQERRLRLEEEQHPLEVQAKQITAQHYLLDTQLKFLQAQRSLNDKAAEGELLGLSLRAAQSPDGWNDDLAQQAYSIVTRNPGAGAGQIGLTIAKSIQASKAIQQQKAFLDSQKDMEVSGFTVDPETGRTQVHYRSKSSMTRAFAPANLTKLITDRDLAITEGRTADAEDYQFRIDSEQLKQQQASTRIAQADERLKHAGTKLDLTLREAGYTATPGPDGTMTLTPAVRSPTTAAVTRSQEDLLSADAALISLNSAIDATTAHPEAFGVQGKLQLAAERAKGQLTPGTPMETPIADTQQKASMAFARVAKSLRVDSGNMSRYELNKLEQAGDVLGFEISPQEALSKQRNLRNAVIGQKLRSLKFQNQSVPDSLLLQISSPQELAEMNKNGLPISQALVRRYLQLHPEFDQATGQPR